jgi:hypothetical protein
MTRLMIAGVSGSLLFGMGAKSGPVSPNLLPEGSKVGKVILVFCPKNGQSVQK